MSVGWNDKIAMSLQFLHERSWLTFGSLVIFILHSLHYRYYLPYLNKAAILVKVISHLPLLHCSYRHNKRKFCKYSSNFTVTSYVQIALPLLYLQRVPYKGTVTLSAFQNYNWSNGKKVAGYKTIEQLHHKAHWYCSVCLTVYWSTRNFESTRGKGLYYNPFCLKKKNKK